MAWVLKADRPIYLQLTEQLEFLIASGQYPVGTRLPPVRDLAAQASVNPNTMQKAMAELERRGLLYTQRTSGRFITNDADKIQKSREVLAAQQLDSFLQRMELLGYTKKEALDFARTAVEEEKPHE